MYAADADHKAQGPEAFKKWSEDLARLFAGGGSTQAAPPVQIDYDRLAKVITDAAPIKGPIIGTAYISEDADVDKMAKKLEFAVAGA